MEKYHSSDNQIRSAKVNKSTGRKIKRQLNLLYPLDTLRQHINGDCKQHHIPEIVNPQLRKTRNSDLNALIQIQKSSDNEMC